MKTSTAYHGFAMQNEELNKELVKRVKAVAPVERLYLLGLTTTHRRTETLFSVQSATRNEVTHCYLLALVENDDHHFLHNLQEKLENNLHQLVPATVIVFSISQFSNWLLDGHPFASAVYQKAFQLYQKDDLSLPGPAPINEEAINKEADRLLNQTKTRVQEFLAGAELYTIRIQYKMAVFMLHQAAEQSLRAMLIIHAGLRVNTHSIDRLIRLCTMFCYELPKGDINIIVFFTRLSIIQAIRFIDLCFKIV